MTTTPIARLEALEAEAFRAQHHQVQVAARLDHITNASDLLRAILARLGGKPEQGSGD